MPTTMLISYSSHAADYAAKAREVVQRALADILHVDALFEDAVMFSRQSFRLFSALLY